MLLSTLYCVNIVHYSTAGSYQLDQVTWFRDGWSEELTEKTVSFAEVSGCDMDPN